MKIWVYSTPMRAFVGISTHAKPVNPLDGEKAYEVDTGKTFIAFYGDWYEYGVENVVDDPEPEPDEE